MKRFNLLIIIIIFTTYSSAAQLSAGFKAGVNLSSIKGSGYTDPDQKTLAGFYMGGLINYSINKRLSLQPELYFSREGTQWKGPDYDQTNRLNYLNIPVLFQFRAPTGLFVHTGPQVGFLVSAHMRYRKKSSVGGINNRTSQDQFIPYDIGTQRSDIINNYASAQAAWVLGAGFFQEGGFGINARYNIGLSNALKQSSVTSVYTRVFNLGIIYMFESKKK